MAQRHKSAVEVEIARTEEESALHSFVNRYWKLGLLAFVAISGFVLFQRYKENQSVQAVSDNWSQLGSEVTFGSGFSTEITPSSPAAMATIASEFPTQPVGGWAKALQAKAHLDAGETTEAVQALNELKQSWPNHPAASLELPLGEDLTGSLSTTVSERLSALAKWKEDNSSLFSNKALPEGSPRVLIKTSRGDLTLGLFQEEAPVHVANFLKLCGEGYYDQTKFHRVIANVMIQGGDPNSISGAPETWGLGGPEEKLEPEFGELKHFKHVLSAAKSPSDIQSNGSQFFITTAASHQYDGVHTVYGVLLEGSSVLEDIESSPVEGDRPVDPAIVISTQVL